MPFFTSSREKYIWIWVFVVFIAIFSSLFIGQPIIKVLMNSQDIQAAIFMLGMLLVGISIVVHVVKTRPGKAEIAIVLGVVAVYIMLFLRLGLPERSHLIEYSVLAILIHRALGERNSQGIRVPKPGLAALIITFLIGVIDESVQLLLPHRVFDPVDILFNGMAATMAIGSSLIYLWVRKRMGKPV